LAGPDLPPRAGSALSAGRALLAQLPAATKSLGQRLAASVRDAVSLHAIGAHRTAQSAVPVIVGIDSLQSHSTVKPAQLVRNHLATSLAARYLPSDLRQAELDRAAERRAASHVKAVGCAGVLAAKCIRGSVLKSRAKDLVAKGASADEVDASFEQLGRAFFCPVWFTKESLPVSRSKAAPQQHNSCDCGVWAGANAEAWAVRAALPHVTSADVKEGLTRIVTADWVPRAEVALRREVLASRVWQATVMRPSTAAEYRLCRDGTGTTSTGIEDPSTRAGALLLAPALAELKAEEAAAVEAAAAPAAGAAAPAASGDDSSSVGGPSSAPSRSTAGLSIGPSSGRKPNTAQPAAPRSGTSPSAAAAEAEAGSSRARPGDGASSGRASAGSGRSRASATAGDASADSAVECAPNDAHAMDLSSDDDVEDEPAAGEPQAGAEADAADVSDVDSVAAADTPAGPARGGRSRTRRAGP